LSTEQQHGRGLRLKLPDGGEPLTSLPEINAALGSLGAAVWPLDLTDAPADIKKLLALPSLTEAEKDRVLAHFLLPRERLLEIIAAAGREPQVPGGGELTTYVLPHDYSYPQLYLVEAGVDYSRFDRFHVNLADDGTGVDEVMIILSGGGISLLQHPSGGGLLALDLDCPEIETGWIVTYDGAYPHIGSISQARAGTKLVMQVIGPPRWTMTYEVEG
jgi:hypothetical protein